MDHHIVLPLLDVFNVRLPASATQATTIIMKKKNIITLMFQILKHTTNPATTTISTLTQMIIINTIIKRTITLPTLTLILTTGMNPKKISTGTKT